MEHKTDAVPLVSLLETVKVTLPALSDTDVPLLVKDISEESSFTIVTT